MVVRNSGSLMPALCHRMSPTFCQPAGASVLPASVARDRAGSALLCPLVRFILLLTLLTSSALADCSGPFRPEMIYVMHSALGTAPQSADTGLAPGSLFDVQIEALYQCGQLSSED